MVLDGELVAVSDDGDVDFYRLGERMLMKRPQRTVTLCAFDVLWLDGIDCTQLPYRDRRRVLEMLELSGPAWCTVPRFVVYEADDLLEACVKLHKRESCSKDSTRAMCRARGQPTGAKSRRPHGGAITVRDDYRETYANGLFSRNSKRCVSVDPAGDLAHHCGPRRLLGRTAQVGCRAGQELGGTVG